MGSATRRGFWAAIIHGALALVAALASPLVGIVIAVMFFGFAWGIRVGRAWAAIAAVCFLLAPLPFAAARMPSGNAAGFAVMAAIELVFGFFLARAAIELWRNRGNRAVWPWAPAAAAFVVFWMAFHPFAIASGSMANTIRVGDQILVETVSWQLGRTPAIGDLVAIHYPLDRQQQFIKRVVAGPGDRIRIRDKKLYRNGQEAVEPYAIHSTSFVDPYRDNFPSVSPSIQLPDRAQEMLRDVQNGELVVPAGQYFLLGDNRDDSLDSRYWGFISASDITGSPVLIYGSHEPSGMSLRTTRWNRLGKLLR
jgi:signal peptidase I